MTGSASFPRGRGSREGEFSVLMVCMGNRVDALSEEGTLLRSYPLEGIGWSVIDAGSGRFAYVGNWFTGEVIKLDLASGDIVARTMVAERCMAGIAQYLPQKRLLFGVSDREPG